MTLQNLTIRARVALGLLACLAIYGLLSAASTYVLTSRALEERVLTEELPARLEALRAEVQAPLLGPLNAALELAANPYLLHWESQGEPDDGVALVSATLGRAKELHKATSVSWISAASGNYTSEKGRVRKVSDSEEWFKAFISGGQKFRFNIDRDSQTGRIRLFINARIADGARTLGMVGLGLSLESLATSIREYRIGQSGLVMLVRQDGRIVVHRDATVSDGTRRLADVLGLTDEQSRRLFAAQPGSSWLELNDRDHSEDVVAAMPLPDLGLAIVAVVPKSEITGAVQSALARGALTGSLLGGLIAVAVMFAIVRTISAPIERAAEALESVADGDFDLKRRLPETGGPDVRRVATAFNRFAAALEGTVTRVKAAARLIEVASADVAAGSDNLNAKTAKASNALAKVSGELSRLTAQARLGSEAAQRAGNLARSAQAVVGRGNASSAGALAVMSDLASTSRRIETITKLMDELAAQTNILSLNAAVEAANAGQHGRGFAVVASEVRALAQRSADSSKEVRQLIEAAASQTKVGAERVGEVDATMGEIAQAFDEVARLLSNQRESSDRQAVGMEAVNAEVSDLDRVTQANSELIRESAAAGQSMREQARELSAAVHHFEAKASR